MTTVTRPDRTEATPYYFAYIDQVPAGEIGDILASQAYLQRRPEAITERP